MSALFTFDGAQGLLNFLVRRPQTVVLAFPAVQCCLSVALVVERLSVRTANVVEMVLQPLVERRLFLRQRLLQDFHSPAARRLLVFILCHIASKKENSLKPQGFRL